MNAWYVKTEVRGADSGPLRGKQVVLKDNRVLNVIVAQAICLSWDWPVHSKAVSIMFVEPILGANPEIALAVLKDGQAGILGKPILDCEMLKADNATGRDVGIALSAGHGPRPTGARRVRTHRALSDTDHIDPGHRRADGRLHHAA